MYSSWKDNWITLYSIRNYEQRKTHPSHVPESCIIADALFPRIENVSQRRKRQSKSVLYKSYIIQAGISFQAIPTATHRVMVSQDFFLGLWLPNQNLDQARVVLPSMVRLKNRHDKSISKYHEFRMHSASVIERNSWMSTVRNPAVPLMLTLSKRIDHNYVN